MKKNRILSIILLILITFTTLFSSSVSYATVTKDDVRNSLPQTNAFEMTITELMLTVGDFASEYLTFLLKEEVTIQKIIFNKVDALNANFFTNGTNASKAPATTFIRTVVNEWYAFLQKIAIIVYMVVLLVIGIKIILKGAEGKANAQSLILKWTMGIIILFFFPYIMRYAFDLNEAFIRTIQRVYDPGDSLVGSYVGMISDLRVDDLEERSPQYVSKSSYILSLGSEEATAAYINRLEEYKARGDMMRIMRALAGITGRIIYAILWYIMFFQLLVFIFIYLKRYLMIAFLIAIFPITLIQYIIGTVSTGKQSGLSTWCKEFFVNVFVQTIHAVVYGIIAGVIMNQIYAKLGTNGQYDMNWFLLIVAINFIFTGEKILKEIINAIQTETIKDASDVSKDMRGKTRGGFRRIIRFIPK